MIWAGVPCSPCLQPGRILFRERIGTVKKVFECWRGTHECMVAITAEEVHGVVVRQMRRSRRSLEQINSELNGIEFLIRLREL